ADGDAGGAASGGGVSSVFRVTKLTPNAADTPNTRASATTRTVRRLMFTSVGALVAGTNHTSGFLSDQQRRNDQTYQAQRHHGGIGNDSRAPVGPAAFRFHLLLRPEMLPHHPQPIPENLEVDPGFAHAAARNHHDQGVQAAGQGAGDKNQESQGETQPGSAAG